MVIVLGLNDLRNHVGTQYAQLKIPCNVYSRYRDIMAPEISWDWCSTRKRVFQHTLNTLLRGLRNVIKQMNKL